MTGIGNEDGRILRDPDDDQLTNTEH
jgi:hypothetical protein